MDTLLLCIPRLMQLVFSWYSHRQYTCARGESQRRLSLLTHPSISTDTLALHGAGVRTIADTSTVGAAAEMLLADMIV